MVANCIGLFIKCIFNLEKKLKMKKILEKVKWWLSKPPRNFNTMRYPEHLLVLLIGVLREPRLPHVRECPLEPILQGVQDVGGDEEVEEELRHVPQPSVLLLSDVYDDWRVVRAYRIKHSCRINMYSANSRNAYMPTSARKKRDISSI